MDLFLASNKVKKVGIYIPKPYTGRRTYSEEDLPFGLKSIISQIDLSQFSIGYANISNYNEYDYLLYSVNDYSDYLILIRDFYKKNIKPKVILGGADMMNPKLIRDIADIIVFGRGEDQVNDILNGIYDNNIWVRDNDYELKNKYKIRQPVKLLKVGGQQENNVGCQYKCKFCQYGNKFPLFIKRNGYSSGMSDHTGNREVMFRDVVWKNAKSKLTTSIDGSTEHTRKMVGKPLKNDEIIYVIKGAYELDYKHPLVLNIYNIIGFPWETQQDAELTEILSWIKDSDNINDRNIIWLLFKFQHFIPMPYTPLRLEALNKINYREIVMAKYGDTIYKGKNIHAKIHYAFPSPIYAAKRTIINRADEIDDLILKLSYGKKYDINQLMDHYLLEKINESQIDYFI